MLNLNVREYTFQVPASIHDRYEFFCTTRKSAAALSAFLRAQAHPEDRPAVLFFLFPPCVCTRLSQWKYSPNECQMALGRTRRAPKFLRDEALSHRCRR